MDVTYRLAEIKDWQSLATFRNKYSGEQFEVDRKHFEQDFIETQNKNQGPLYIAEACNEIVGYGRCGYFDASLGQLIYGLLSEVPNGYYLKGVLTDEGVRGTGIGKTLTTLRHDWVRKYAHRIYCILQKTNTASLRMHEHLGYQIIKEKLAYRGVLGDESGLLLELIL